MIKKEYFWPLIIAILTLLLGQGVLSKLYYTPKLSYEIFPPHIIGEQETFSVIIKNQGRTLLHNVVISIKSEYPIFRIRLEGPEVMDPSGNDYVVSGKIGGNAIKLKLDRLVRQSNYSLTLLTKKDSKVNLVIVSDETDAKKEVPKTGMGLSDFLISLTVAFFTGFLSFAAFSFNRLKSLKTKIDALVSVKECLDERRKSGQLVRKYFEQIVTALSKIMSILDGANECSEDPHKLMAIIEASKGLINDLNTMLKGFSEIIVVEGVCFETKKDHK